MKHWVGLSDKGRTQLVVVKTWKKAEARVNFLGNKQGAGSLAREPEPAPFPAWPAMCA
jgi:hypothetical protein